MKQALYYKKGLENYVYCLLCPQGCKIKEGNKGLCKVRENKEGILYTNNYGRCTSIAIDPVEKKPLYHFYPGSKVLSIGTKGCNLKCGFCQNWTISQSEPKTRILDPKEAVGLAVDGGNDCIGIAYTYSEPTIWYEYVLDTAKLLKEEGKANILITNGFIEQAPLQELLPYIDGMNIDLKGFKKSFYRRVCAGDLDPVLRTIEIALEATHVELTNLIIPTFNDDESEIEELTDWVAGLGEDIPLHFSRYHPSFNFDVPPTPVETLIRAREIGLSKLNYVYIGNIWDAEYSHTYCPECSYPVIKREGMSVKKVDLVEGKCVKCGYLISMVT